MKKSDTYRSYLASTDDWEPYLRRESSLPGPRGNLELAQVAAETGSLARFEAWLAADAAHPTADTPDMFLAFCAVVGLGCCIARNLSSGDEMNATELDLLWGVLRRYATDSRWRMREASAMALQEIGAVSMDALYSGIETWRRGNWLEKRAVVAGLAEPRLLLTEQNILRSLGIIDEITTSISIAGDRSGDDFRVLRQCLGYAWSVVVASSPTIGVPYMGHWLDSPDSDIRWIMKENLKKKRLEGIFTPG